MSLKSFIWIGVFFIMSSLVSPSHGQNHDPENTLHMVVTYKNTDNPEKTEEGRVVIRLRPDLAPQHVARIKELVRQGYYDGTPFHRVIDGFMVQGGDPTGTGTGGSGQNLKAEFSKEKHLRGTVSMARAASRDSADSQFFICLEAAPSLNRKYTIWGEVIEGMEYVDKIKKGSSALNGQVDDPDKIVTLKVAGDDA